MQNKLYNNFKYFINMIKGTANENINIFDGFTENNGNEFWPLIKKI